jgi:2-polyprenyl-3-methyl-5-hydroxy-6-metoxy-1,4-benzoquinol methylase
MKCKICDKKTKIWYRKLFDDRHGYTGYFDIYKCPNCGFAITNPQITKNKIINLYTKYYPRQNLNLENIKRSNYKKIDRFEIWKKGLLNTCEYWIKEKSKVLDVGSGLGYGLLRLEEAMKCKAYGIDPDANAKRFANKFKLNFHHGFIEDNPFKNIRFDYVIANQVLEHTDNPIRFLNICKSRLNKNGKIILSFPNTNGLHRIIFGRNWLHWHVPYHLNHFNLSSIKELTNKSGLKIEKIQTITPNMWTNLQIRRILSKPENGIRDTFWDGNNKNNNTIIKSKTYSKLTRFLENNNYLNRLVDLLGFGESFLVILGIS